MKTIAITSLTLTLAVVLAAPAMGDTVYLQSHGQTGPQTVIYGDGYTTGINVHSGIYRWTVNTTTDPPTGRGWDVPGWGFCIDLPDNPATAYYNVTDLEYAPQHDPEYGAVPMGPAKAALIDELWGRYGHDEWLTNPYAYQGHAEIMSVAIWEIIYEHEGVYDVTVDSTGDSGTTLDGGFYVRQDTVDYVTANLWLDSLDGSGPVAGVFAVSHESGQDFAVIPAPGAALLGVMGLGLVGWARRRFS